MKIKQTCAKCVSEAKDKIDDSALLTLEIRDDGLYDCTCQNGHTTLVVLRNEKFEMLFESGAMALSDGYKREAVSSFATALERFLEFYIKVILLKHGISRNEFDKSWNSVAVQSERQLGAFFFLYLLENKKSVNFITQKSITLRNKIIHKGYIPTFDEALQYGEAVLSFIFEISKELKASSAEFVRKVTNQLVSETMGSKKDSHLVISGITTIINMNNWAESFGANTLKESLERMKDRK